MLTMKLNNIDDDDNMDAGLFFHCRSRSFSILYLIPVSILAALGVANPLIEIL